jgi:CheY-like chemotaxis protein
VRRWDRWDSVVFDHVADACPYAPALAAWRSLGLGRALWLELLAAAHAPEVDPALASPRLSAPFTPAALPIIAMTAHPMAGDRERFIAQGFDGYVGKPFTRGTLLAEIDGVGRAA